MASPSSPYNEYRVLPVATLTSIATVIGSGILALPVTLYNTSLPLFLTFFTLSAIAQIGVVYVIVELMQRASHHNSLQTTKSTYSATHSPPAPPPKVSLFTIADLFLPTLPLRYLFFITTFLLFLTLLVSYGLAGPQALWQVVTPGASVSPPPVALFVAYWAVGTTAVLFFVDPLLPVFSSFTVVKGILFIAVVIIVSLLPESAHVASLPNLFSSFSGWNSAAAPFLMSCVALGALSTTVPVTYNLLPTNATRKQVARYRMAIIAAVLLCYLLNVGWVISMLLVVPRVAPPGVASLTTAYEQGQISTVPLIDTLVNGGAVTGGVLKAIEVIVEMFTFVSTAVSFFMLAAGLKSFVDGGADNMHVVFPVLGREDLRRLIRAGYQAVSFGSILYIIVANPNGFIVMLTRFTSFTQNLSAGAFLFVMAYFSRGKRRGPLAAQEDGAEGGEQGIEVGTENVSKELLEVKEGSVERDIPLAMSAGAASAWIIFGGLFFSLACALAAVGPFLGINIGGPE